MNQPAMSEPIRVGDDTRVLPSWMPLPGYGLLPVNAFVIHAREPVLVDCGLPAVKAQFLASLWQAVDPADLKWVWLTHVDMDHVGALEAILEAAPGARVVTSYLGLGKLSLRLSIPPERVYLINPGQTLDVGDRELAAVRPPIFDAPETCGVLDLRTRRLFTSDAFGALLAAPSARAEDIAGEALVEGMRTWATVDAPWLPLVDRSRFGAQLDALAGLDPSAVLSSHLPPAGPMLPRLTSVVAGAPDAPPFVGPDQAAMAALMSAAP